ncbi:MAG: DUF2842 domain-containing protein [Pseudomonadota bacterium]
MTSNARKLTGTAMMVVLIFVYFLFVLALAPALITDDTHWSLQLIFYAIAGAGWAIPGALLIKWMAKPDA